MDRKNKVMAALAIGAVVILAASSLVRCGMTRPGGDRQAEGGTDEVGQAVPADGGTTDSTLETLRSSAWKSADGTCSITFKEGRYVESDGTRSVLSTFDVGTATDEDGQTAIIVSLDSDGGKARDSLIVVRRDARGALTVASDDFRLSKTYVQAASGTLSVTGVNDELRELYGGSTDALSEALASYAATHVPGASTARWRGVLVIDYNERCATTSFTCDDAASTLLTVDYSLADKTYSVSG